MGKQTVESLVARAGELLGTPSWAKAEKLIRESLRREPENRNARRVWARCLTDHLDRPAEALEILAELEPTARDYDLGDVFFQKGRALYKLGRFAESAAAWDSCLANLVPNEKGAIKSLVLTNLAAALKTIDLRRALDSSDLAIDAWVEQGAGWYNKACYEALLGDIERANRALAVSVRLDRKYARDWTTDPDFDACRARIERPPAKALSKTQRAAFVSLWGEIQTWRAFVGADLRGAIDVMMEETLRSRTRRPS